MIPSTKIYDLTRNGAQLPYFTAKRRPDIQTNVVNSELKQI